MKFDITKVANAIIYMLDSESRFLNHRKIALMIFLVDFYHLEQYGVKVFGDDYVKDPREPKSVMLDNLFQVIIEDDEIDETDDSYFLIGELMEYLDIDVIHRGRYKELKFFKRYESFNDEMFSETEFEILEYIIKKYKNETSRKTANSIFRIDDFRAVDNGDIII